MQHSPEENLAAVLGLVLFVFLMFLGKGFSALMSKITGIPDEPDEDTGYDFPDPRRFK